MDVFGAFGTTHHEKTTSSCFSVSSQPCIGRKQEGVGNNKQKFALGVTSTIVREKLGPMSTMSHWKRKYRTFFFRETDDRSSRPASPSPNVFHSWGSMVQGAGVVGRAAPPPRPRVVGARGHQSGRLDLFLLLGSRVACRKRDHR